MKVFRLSITETELNSIPEDERLFFIQTGQILNDLNILQKFLIISSNKLEDTTDTTERKGKNSQSLLITRLLAGKLHESWELLKRIFFSARISQQYEQSLSPSAKDGLNKLKKYYGKQNLITQIRNEYSFLYSNTLTKRYFVRYTCTKNNGY